MPPSDVSPSYTIISGGVGGAKLVLGFDRVLTPDHLQVIANTGDDFEHLGLPICPDIDTLIYTLADLANPATGWGLRDESWQFMAALEELGGETWFRLGDRDLATHIRRRELLAGGLSLTGATTRLRESMGVATRIWPMSNDPVRTQILTADATIEFQDYFVRQQAAPTATGFNYQGCATASASAECLAALGDPSLGGIFIAPSNPWLSIDPILALADIKSAIINASVPVIAISPIVAGKALKGPTAKIMTDTGLNPSVISIAEHYRDVIDGLIIDTQDADKATAIEAMGLRTGITPTVMTKLNDKTALAEFAMNFAATLRGELA